MAKLLLKAGAMFAFPILVREKIADESINPEVNPLGYRREYFASDHRQWMVFQDDFFEDQSLDDFPSEELSSYFLSMERTKPIFRDGECTELALALVCEKIKKPKIVVSMVIIIIVIIIVIIL
eukprot:GHVU01099446.1.p1 GENE.GHVU01099446.1~~GHVU01099446.1.p1  ORF type:complete len:123 (+),score=18.40 GHVU01099446.1:418-786(+)